MTEAACVDCGKPKSEERRQSLTRGRCRACYQRQVYALKKSGAFAAIAPASPQERLFSRAVPGRNGCIIWTGVINPKNGYGQISVDGKAAYAHRLAYQLFKGAIPAGLAIDHACHNRDAECPGGNCIHHLCINPHHLDAVSYSENRLRSPHTKTSANGEKSHCKHGHAFTPDNTMIISSTGTRVCATCHRRRQREYMARKRAAA
jgi:hypothetical protein